MVLRRRALLLVLAAVGLTAGLLVGALAAALHCRRHGDSSCHRAGHGASAWGWVSSGWAADGNRNIISGADGISHGARRKEGTVAEEPAGARRGRGRSGMQPTLREERGMGREWAWHWREQLRTWRRRGLLQYEFFPAGEGTVGGGRAALRAASSFPASTLQPCNYCGLRASAHPSAP